ncbi:conserved Plasmodium protein, unknown function [Plasmodium gaboni]|uniref:Uncharacterized protein n=1 Tax=Plasmodium gaboni TaxID=647221 RepID=A0ABY1UKH0_9APIC|nr:conserved Plasmodium protein, unknown function [Plasmodium gaboni]
MEERHINFQVFKSSYLEKKLKIQDMNESVKKKRNDKKKEIMEIICQETSHKMLNGNNDDSCHNNDNSCYNNNYYYDEKQNISISELTNPINSNTSDIHLKEEKNKNIIYKKYNYLYSDPRETKKKIQEFINKYKDRYNIFKQKKLPLCNNVDELFNNNYKNDKEENYHYQLTSLEKYNNNIKSIISLNEQNKKYHLNDINNFIQKNIIKNKSLNIETILNNIKSAFDDFIDVYIEKPNTDIDFLYNKIYEEKNKNNINNINNKKYNNNNNINESNNIYECNLLKCINEKEKNFKDIKKKINEPYEYVNIMSHYMNSNKSSIKVINHIKPKCNILTKDNLIYNEHVDNIKEKIKDKTDQIILNNVTEEYSNDEIINTQTNDKNVVDVSLFTHKYKYRSNIIFTINKIKNIEKIIEINIYITDVQLKIPGMRIENIILPYKYNNDILKIEIKTLKNKLNNNNKKKKEDNILNKHIYNNINKFHCNSSSSDHSSGSKKNSKTKIKCYYAFIPLINIQDEIINKRLILIKSKNKKIYEKEKLLPDTLYLIQSKDITSSKEKYFYISIKKCIHGIHYYPNKINHQNENIQHNYFTPIYVSLYNDNVDNYIAHIINENNYIEKIKIQKIIESDENNNYHNNKSQGSYIINNMYFKFFFNHNNELVYNNENNTITNNSQQYKAINIFHFLYNNYISIKCPLDLIPLYLLPAYQDVQFLDFIEKNELLKLKFLLHLLSIMESICIHLCSLMNIKINVPPLFIDHLKSVEIKDERNQKNYFTFSYTSCKSNQKNIDINDENIKKKNNNNNNDDDNNNFCRDEKNYFVNYIKPFIFRFHNVNKKDLTNNFKNINKYNNNNNNCGYSHIYLNDSISIHQDLQNDIISSNQIHMEKINDNDLFIYEYAKKQSLFIYNIIKDYDDIKDIHKFYDQEKNIFYTTNYNKHSFQNFYIHIIDKYNKIINKPYIYKQEKIYLNEDEKKKEHDILFFKNNQHRKDNILSIQYDHNVKKNITNNNNSSSKYDNLQNYYDGCNLINQSKNQIANNLISLNDQVAQIKSYNIENENYFDFFKKEEENNKYNNNVDDVHKYGNNVDDIYKYDNNVDDIHKYDNNVDDIHKYDNNVDDIHKYDNNIDDIHKYIQHNNPLHPYYSISSNNEEIHFKDKTHIQHFNNRIDNKTNWQKDMCDHKNSTNNEIHNKKKNNNVEKEIKKNYVEYKNDFITSNKKFYEDYNINKNFSFSPKYLEGANEFINESVKEYNNMNKEKIEFFQEDKKKEITEIKKKKENNNNNKNNLSYVYGQTNINNKKDIMMKEKTKSDVKKYSDDNYNNRKKNCKLIKSNIYKI